MVFIHDSQRLGTAGQFRLPGSFLKSRGRKILESAEDLTFHRRSFACHAVIGMTGIMPPAGLCRIEFASPK
jgi:hypothetical protein